MRIIHGQSHDGKINCPLLERRQHLRLQALGEVDFDIRVLVLKPGNDRRQQIRGDRRQRGQPAMPLDPTRELGHGDASILDLRHNTPGIP